jgi:hypothetical protein
MAASWPITLEQKLNEAGFTIGFPVSYIESETEIGPKKRRRRTTLTYEILNCSLLLEKTYYSTFKNFYDVTINGGVLPFEFNHPITGVLTNYRMAAPAITPVGGTYFNLAMTWEQVP